MLPAAVEVLKAPPVERVRLAKVGLEVVATV